MNTTSSHPKAFRLRRTAALAALLAGALWLLPAPSGMAGDRSSRWSAAVGAAAWMQIRMPGWTEGWLKAGVSWGETRQPAVQPTLTGRDINETSHHVLLMRCKSGVRGPRSWKPNELAHSSRPWDSRVYQDPWPVVSDLAAYQPDSDSTATAPSNQEYSRFGQYVTWSE